MPAEVLLLFFATALLLAVVPGPDNIFVLTQSLSYGARAGWLVVLGLCSGLLLHTSLVAAGLAALIAASGYALLSIKLLGGGYLLFLAWQSWPAAKLKTVNIVRQPLSSAQLYRRGIIMNTTNPKIMVFFVAFLPQFVDISYGAIGTQIVLLGLLFIVATILVFGAIAQLAGHYSRLFGETTDKRILLNRTISIIFVLLAANLLLGFI